MPRRPPRPTNEFHAAWSQEVAKALNERGLSVHAAARRAGISPGALQAWLHQGVEPDRANWPGSPA
jgi:transposase-like protein